MRPGQQEVLLLADESWVVRSMLEADDKTADQSDWNRFKRLLREFSGIVFVVSDPVAKNLVPVEFGFIGGVIVWGIWYSFKVLKQAVLDIISACRNTDILGGGWALLAQNYRCSPDISRDSAGRHPCSGDYLQLSVRIGSDSVSLATLPKLTLADLWFTGQVIPPVFRLREISWIA